MPTASKMKASINTIWLQVLDEKDRVRILSPYSKVQEWIENTKIATKTHFDDVHAVLYRAKARLQKQRENAQSQPSSKAALRSKI